MRHASGHHEPQHIHNYDIGAPLAPSVGRVDYSAQDNPIFGFSSAFRKHQQQQQQHMLQPDSSDRSQVQKPFHSQGDDTFRPASPLSFDGGDDRRVADLVQWAQGLQLRDPWGEKI